MAGISGNISGDEKGAPSDLELIYEGGDHFLERMKALANAQASAKKALEALNIGNDIAKARSDAEEALAAAKKELENASQTAEKLLSNAKSESGQMLEEARATAKETTDRANSDAYSLTLAAKEDRESASKLLAEAKAQAQKILTEADIKTKSIEAEWRSVKDAEAEVEALKAKYSRAISDTELARQAYERKMKQMQAIFDQPAASG